LVSASGKAWEPVWISAFTVRHTGPIRSSPQCRNSFRQSSRVADDVCGERAPIDAANDFGTWGELRIGPVWRTVRRIQTGSQALPEADTNVSGARIKLVGDTMAPSLVFARRPPFRHDRLSATSQWSECAVLARELAWNEAASFGGHTFQGFLYGGSNFGNSLPAYDSFLLGGPFRLTAYVINQFSGSRRHSGPCVT